jgi:fatty acid desaturase
MSRRPILNHPEDIHCIAFHMLVLAAYGLAFWIYLHPSRASIDGPWSLAAFVTASAILLGWISGIDIGINFHNHAHRSIFNNAFLSRWFGRLWTFSGGWPSYLWRHAHVVVHHANLLDPQIDWTVARRKPDGTTENMFIYMFCHWPWRYGKHLWIEFANGPVKRRNAAIKEVAIFAVLWSIPFWIDVKMALLLWVIPHWVANAFAMGAGMWVQHEGCVEVTDARPHSHSNDHLSHAFNATTFNIGYHIEHHEHPLVHWSELPALHEQMKDELLASGANFDPLGYSGAANRAYGEAALSALFRRGRATAPQT